MPMVSMTISMYSAITLMMNWYEAIMALSPFWTCQIAAIFFSRLADRSRNEWKSDLRKFLQNDNEYKHRMLGRRHQTFIFLSHFCNEAIGYLAKRDELPRLSY
jgi:hypothetical protein